MRWLATVDPKRVPLFGAAAVGLVAAALALYVVLPQAKARSTAFEEKAVRAEAAAAAVRLAAERATLEDAVRNLVASSGATAEPVLRQTLESTVIAQLQDLAWSHDVELVAIQPREGATIDTLRETVFDVELVGGYGDMVEYLRHSRVELEALVVRELSLMPLDDSAEPQIHAVLVAAAFGEER
jgi:hypothetical protein